MTKPAAFKVSAGIVGGSAKLSTIATDRATSGRSSTARFLESIREERTLLESGMARDSTQSRTTTVRSPLETPFGSPVVLPSVGARQSGSRHLGRVMEPERGSHSTAAKNGCPSTRGVKCSGSMRRKLSPSGKTLHRDNYGSKRIGRPL
jgi:hypothetical protein